MTEPKILSREEREAWESECLAELAEDYSPIDTALAEQHVRALATIDHFERQRDELVEALEGHVDYDDIQILLARIREGA